MRPAEQRGAASASRGRADPSTRRDGFPRQDRLRFPLRAHRLERAVFDRSGRRQVRGLPNQDPAHRRSRLQPGGDVDEIGDDPLALPGEQAMLHERLARVGANSDAELGPVLAVAQFGDGVADGQRGPDGALRIVLVRDRSPKTAITSSPMNFSTVPPWRSTCRRRRRGRGRASAARPRGRAGRLGL